jgi:hypothetical protein
LKRKGAAEEEDEAALSGGGDVSVTGGAEGESSTIACGGVSVSEPVSGTVVCARGCSAFAVVAIVFRFPPCIAVSVTVTWSTTTHIQGYIYLLTYLDRLVQSTGDDEVAHDDQHHTDQRQRECVVEADRRGRVVEAQREHGRRGQCHCLADHALAVRCRD